MKASERSTKNASASQKWKIPFYKYEYADYEGYFMNWSKNFDNLVRGNTKLELIVAIALSAPLYYRLQHIEGLNLQPLCTKWHLVSKRNEGADYATWLALSIFGNPDELMEEIGSPERVSKCGYLRGFRKAHKSTDLYEYNSLKVATDGNSVCLFASQKGIATKLNALHRDKGKLVVRDVNGPFCKPSQGKAIEKAFGSNYGKTVRAFIKKIAETRTSNKKLTDKFNQSRDTIEKTLEKANFGHYKTIDSLANSFALIYLAAKYANTINISFNGDSSQRYGIKIDLAKLRGELVNVAKASLKEEPETEAIIANVIDKLKTWKPMYGEKFFGFSLPCKDGSSRYEVFTFPTPFKVMMGEVCKNFGISRPKLLRILAEKEYLDTSKEKVSEAPERDRFQKRRNGRKGYSMLIPESEWNSK